MVNWYLGTVGFGYRDWRDQFYPSWIESRNYLAHYSQYFNAVELNSVFHGIPKVDRVKNWAAATPDDFCFSPKTPKIITHEFGLSTSLPQMATFLQTMRALGKKLGPVLIQWPPSFTIQQLPHLEAFLAELPTDMRFAIEFRHRSWHVSETWDLLTHYRAAAVSVDYVHSPKRIDVTTDFLYIRWLGEHGRFPDGREERIDLTQELKQWADDLQPHLKKASAVYGYFNNDYAGYAPKTCNRFKSLIGLSTQYPQFPTQSSLF